MKYLYVVAGEKPVQSDRVPTSVDMENIVEGYLQVIRSEYGVFQELTPIDVEDIGNWTKIEEVF